MLTNNTPGVSFQAADLVKNLLLSAFLEKPIQFQDDIYQRLWRTNIQERVANIDSLLGVSGVINHIYCNYNYAADSFLSRAEGPDRYISQYEKTILTFCHDGDENEEREEEEEEEGEEKTRRDSDKFLGIRLYARFHSFYEDRTKDTDDLENVHLEILQKLNDFSLSPW